MYPAQKNRQNIRTKVHFEDPAQLEWRGRRRFGVHCATYGMDKVTKTQSRVRRDSKQMRR
jgi:hypothetical protein